MHGLHGTHARRIDVMDGAEASCFGDFVGAPSVVEATIASGNTKHGNMNPVDAASRRLDECVTKFHRT
ncbi:MAG TPA: hypothetical protein VNR11_15195 [Xanthobacteraceae bacterium]|nr:hypothetical protein [Xanthobacteraceae bacterium]